MDVEQLKVIVIGEAGAGKTALVERYISDRFEDRCCGIGAAFFSKTLTRQGQTVKLNIWDTAGQERFGSIARLYYRQTSVVLVAFNLNSPDTFAQCAKWITEAQEQISDSFSAVLVGCKADLEHNVSREEAEDFAASLEMPYFETSAKTASGIHEMFGAALEFRQQQKNCNSKFSKRPNAVRIPSSLPECADKKQCSC